MQFLAFPGPELGIRNYDRLINGKKLFSDLKNNYFVCELPDVTCQKNRALRPACRPETKPLQVLKPIKKLSALLVPTRDPKAKTQQLPI